MVSGKVSVEKHYFTRKIAAMVAPKSALPNIQLKQENCFSRIVREVLIYSVLSFSQKIQSFLINEMDSGLRRNDE